MNRREFLKMLGVGTAVAAAPKFIFDVGANLYKRKELIIPANQIVIGTRYCREDPFTVYVTTASEKGEISAHFASWDQIENLGKGDMVEMIKLPKGARVLDVKIHAPEPHWYTTHHDKIVIGMA